MAVELRFKFISIHERKVYCTLDRESSSFRRTKKKNYLQDDGDGNGDEGERRRAPAAVTRSLGSLPNF